MRNKRTILVLKVTTVLVMVVFMIVASLPPRPKLEDERLSPIMLARQAFYAVTFGFEVHIVEDGKIIEIPFCPRDWVIICTDPNSPYFNSLLTDFIFVESANDTPITNGIIGWPMSDTCLKTLIEGLHWVASIENVDLQGVPRPFQIELGDFSLEYPLTTWDLFHNWNNVLTLWFALSNAEQDIIQGWTIQCSQNALQ